MGSLKRLFIGLLSASVLMPGLVQAGTGRQTTTFLVDAKGVIRHIWRKVKVPGHVEAVLAAAGTL